MWAEAYAEAFKTCTKRVCVRIAGPVSRGLGKGRTKIALRATGRVSGLLGDGYTQVRVIL